MTYNQYYDGPPNSNGEYRIVGHRVKKIYVNFKDGFVRKYRDNTTDCSSYLRVNYTDSKAIEITAFNSPLAIFNIDCVSYIEIVYDDSEVGCECDCTERKK